MEKEGEVTESEQVRVLKRALKEETERGFRLKGLLMKARRFVYEVGMGTYTISVIHEESRRVLDALDEAIDESGANP